MEFATGALGTLLPKLGQLLKDEYNLHKGIRKDVEFLINELGSARAALRNVGDVPPEQLSELVTTWARDVRDLSYDMEDIVDTFLVRVQGSAGAEQPPSKKSARRFVKKMVQTLTKATIRHEIGQEIKNVKERVKEVADRRDRYKVDAITLAKTVVVDPRITALYTKAANLVGIDEPREELIRRFVQEDLISEDRMMIVSIVGFGGLGKTTLAKAVYDKLKPQFTCKTFVSVSQTPDLTKVFKDMLYELDKAEYKNIHNTTMGQKHLIDLILEILQDKRYLIVIDDIWDTKPWEIIRCALPENGLKSRIITATRIIDVADHIGGCYKLKPLTHQSSKMLFYGRIFGSEGNCPQQYSDVSETILKKCGGVPLAIITTSSLLANKSRNINEWHNVCDSIGFGLGNNPSIDSMRKILLLSYYDLNPHLKTCLLYLSIFPEDYKIDRYRLIWRWVAEGFVQHEEGMQSLFEIGQSYFNDLLNRSLIQPGNMDDNDMSPFTCRVHDMVLDLIYSLSKEESFATTISGEYKHITSSSERKVRRLSLHNTTWPTMNTSNLRSLTISNSSMVIDSMPPLSCYHLLRVLDLEGCNLMNLQSLEFVGKLFHLRYLSLADSGYAGEVPGDIGRLQFLQTLDIRGTDIKELPLSILGLGQLMRLTAGERTRLPCGLRNLSSLEVLTMIADSVTIGEDLGHLTQLRMLGIKLTKDKDSKWDESLCRVLVGSLSKLHKIQTLGVYVDDNVAADLEGSVASLCSLSHLRISRTTLLPTWINPKSFLLLSHLYITVGQVRSEDIQILGNLQALRHLKLKVEVVAASGIPAPSSVFERFLVSANAFPVVTRCTFAGFSIVPSMFQPGAMPRLQHFWFHVQPEDFCTRCSEFVVDDLGLDHLPSLQSVRLCFYGEEKATQDVATKVEEKLRHEAQVHPNHPDIYIRIDDSLDWIPCMTCKFYDVPEELHHFGYGLSYYLQQDPLRDHLATSSVRR